MNQTPLVVVGSASLEMLIPKLAQHYQVVRGWKVHDPALYLPAKVLVVAGNDPLDFDLLQMMPALELVACATRGYEAIDVARLLKSGLRFSHAENINQDDVADHALGAIILHRRALLTGDQAVRSGAWQRGAGLSSRSLKGARLGIVGLGSIGRAVAQRAAALQMTVSWWGPRPKSSPWARADTLVALARDSEYLVVAAYGQDNHGLVSASVIDALGPDGYLVNVARGQLLDEAALIDALRAGRLGGAALDVFVEEPTPASRWADVPYTLLTPHMAGKTGEAFQRMAEQLETTLAVFFSSPACVATLADESRYYPIRARA